MVNIDSPSDALAVQHAGASVGLQPDDGAEQRRGRTVNCLWLRVKGQKFKRVGVRSADNGKLAMLTFTVWKPKVQHALLQHYSKTKRLFVFVFFVVVVVFYVQLCQEFTCE